MMARRYSFTDSVMFAVTAAVMLWADVAPAVVATTLAVLLGAAVAELEAGS